MKSRSEGAEHLAAEDVAGYLDRNLPPLEQERVEAHAAHCAPCRAELAEVTRLTGFRSRRVARWPVALTAAAAVLAALVVFRPTPIVRHLREPAITVTGAPVLASSTGILSTVPTFTWRSLPHADRYRVSLFDRDGAVLWESDVNDTSVHIPETVHIVRGVPYFWNVAARVGFDRWVTSDLVSFTVAPGPPAK